MKELRNTINRNADYYKKELESIRRNQLKLENSFAKMKAKLKATDSKLNNAEECISDLADRVMEINQSEQQTEGQKMKAT